MVKNGKTTLEKLEGLVNIVARNLAEIKSNMATKDDLKDFATKDDLKAFATKDDIKAFATKMDLEDMERRISAKIEAVDEKLETLEEADVRELQRRVFILEKDVKQIKHKHV